MKKIFGLVFLLLNLQLFAQIENNPSAFSSLNYSVYGGLNFSSDSKVGSTFLVELKTKVLPNVNLNFSAGYQSSYQNLDFTVKTYETLLIDNVNYYYAKQYKITEEKYDIFPLSLGIQYYPFTWNFLPYFHFAVGYNLIDTKKSFSDVVLIPYASLDEIPDEYKFYHSEIEVDNLFNLIIGVGLIFPITSKLFIDIRYFYMHDFDIINTHHLVIGICL